MINQPLKKPSDIGMIFKRDRKIAKSEY